MGMDKLLGKRVKVTSIYNGIYTGILTEVEESYISIKTSFNEIGLAPEEVASIKEAK